MARPKKHTASAVSPQGEGEKKIALTSTEVAITQRIMAESDDWKNIKESEVDDFSEQGDPMQIPEAAQKMKDKKKFAFRWITRTSERLDEVRNLPVPRKWWICNAATTPFLADDCDPILGCVCKLDQMLVFKPYWMFEKDQKRKMDLAERQAGAADLKSKHGKEKDGAFLVHGSEIKAGDTVVHAEVDNLVEGEAGSETA